MIFIEHLVCVHIWINTLIISTTTAYIDGETEAQGRWRTYASSSGWIMTELGCDLGRLV